MARAHDGASRTEGVMPAPKRIPDSKVREALTTWREQLGINVAALRAGNAAGLSPSPIRPSARRAPPRVLPAHVDRLREAKFDLSARYRVETDETAVLAQFIEEAFSGWLASKLETKP